MSNKSKPKRKSCMLAQGKVIKPRPPRPKDMRDWCGGTQLLWGMSLKCALLILCAMSSNADSIIPASRLFNWGAYSGISGGIPYRTTVYTNMTAIDNTGATVVRTAFQNAIDNCPSNQVVQFPAGVFLLIGSGETASISWSRPGITVRGAGPGVTTFVCKGDSGGFSTINIQNGSHDDDFSSATKYDLWNTSLVTGDSNIATTAAHSFAAGDYVWMDQRTNTDYIFLKGSSGDCNFCSGGDRYASQRVYGQFSRVVSVNNSTNVVLSPPICGMFQSTNSPQIMKAAGMIGLNGVESCTFSNATSSTTPYWFHIVGTVNPWFTNVEFSVSRRRFVQSVNTIGMTVQGCYFHHGQGTNWGAGYQADYGYAIYNGYGSCFARIEDNIFYNLHVAVAFEGAIAGNVAYGNFHTNQVYGASCGAGCDFVDSRATSQGALAHHGTSSHDNLWEHNNINATMLFDYVWAGGSMYTVFRNRSKIDAQHDGVDVDQIGVAVDMGAQHRYHNIVGNVFGKAADDKVYYAQGDGCTTGSGLQVVYRFGYINAFDNMDYGNLDNTTTNTLILKNNYNAVTAGVPTYESIGGTNMVDSYLYSSKPSWWGTPSWPSIGPDKTPTIESSMWIPALGRFYAMNGAGVTNWLTGSSASTGVGKSKGGGSAQFP